MKIVAFHDSDRFGGHELMLLKLLPGLLEAPELERLTLFHFRGNALLAAHLDALGGQKLVRRETPFVKRRGEPYCAPFRLAYRRFVSAEIGALSPDLVLLAQGRIENCLAPMLAASGYAAPVVSYIPMAHALCEIRGDSQWHAWGDRLRRRYYRLPQGFAAPSASVAAQLRRAGVEAPIDIVANCVEAPALLEKQEARKRLGAPLAGRLATYFGRFERRQKGLDCLAACVQEASRAAGDDMRYFFVGDGPDRAWLDRAFRDNDRVLVRGWASDASLVYAASDAILLASRFEGTPLVLLEALAAGVPVLASDIDAFSEFLPAASLFDFERPEAFRPALSRCLAPDMRAWFTQAATRHCGDEALRRSRAKFASFLLSFANRAAL